MKAKKPAAAPKGYSITPTMQRYLFGLIAGAFVLQNGYATYQIVQQYAYDPSQFGFMAVISSAVLLPVTLFVIAYVMNPKKLRKLTRAFESLLISIAALAVYGIVTQIIFQITWQIISRSTTISWSMVTQQIVVDVIMALAFTACLYWLRRKKIWA